MAGACHDAPSGYLYINRDDTGIDNGDAPKARLGSMITVMEIGA